MEIDIETVYIKDENINNVRCNRHIKLCTTVNALYPGEIYGAQKMNNIWLMYLRTNRIRVALIVSGFVLDGKHIEVFDENPLKLDGKKSERLVIKDLPAAVPPSCGHGLSRGVSSTQTGVIGNLCQGAFRWGRDVSFY